MSLPPSEFLPEGGKARRVFLLLRDQILSGEYAPGDVLPAEQALARQQGVSRVTIRRALAALASADLVAKYAGRGSVVQAQQADAPLRADFATLMPQLYEMAERTQVQLLSFRYAPPPPPVAKALQSDGLVQTAVRLRQIDGRAFSHLTTHVPEALARQYAEADLANTALYRLLERAGVQIGGADQSVSATHASPEVADALGVSVGAALLSLTRVLRDDEGRGVEYLSALYRPDTFRLEMQLTRVGQAGNRHWEPVIDTPRDEAAL